MIVNEDIEMALSEHMQSVLSRDQFQLIASMGTCVSVMTKQLRKRLCIKDKNKENIIQRLISLKSEEMNTRNYLVVCRLIMGDVLPKEDEAEILETLEKQIMEKNYDNV